MEKPATVSFEGAGIYGLPAMAASMRDRIGLGGTARAGESEGDDGRRVAPCEVNLRGVIDVEDDAIETGGWYGHSSASGENIKELRAYYKSEYAHDR